MAEFKKQIGVGVALAIAAAIIIGFIALNVFPMNPRTTTTGQPVLAANPGGNVSGGFYPGFYVENISCSLNAGSCNFTIVNNYTVSLNPNNTVYVSLASVGCQFYVHEMSAEGVSAGYRVNGTIGGAAANGIPANSKINTSCTVPTSTLTYETNGTIASLGFTVEFLQNSFQFSAGDEPTFDFQGVWGTTCSTTASCVASVPTQTSSMNSVTNTVTGTSSTTCTTFTNNDSSTCR
jgi:hypothetical protein